MGSTFSWCGWSIRSTMGKMKDPHVVGPDHLTPKEWLPDAKSVISYFLPFTEHIRNSNRLHGKPSTEWLYGRYEGEMFNNSLSV